MIEGIPHSFQFSLEDADIDNDAACWIWRSTQSHLSTVTMTVNAPTGFSLHNPVKGVGSVEAELFRKFVHH